MSESALTVVDDLYAAYLKGDMERVLAGLDPDVVWRVVGRRSDHPAFGEWRGRDGAAGFFATVANALAFESFKVDGFYPSQDKVFVMGHYAMVHRSTSRRAASDFVHVLTVRDGLVVEFVEFLDTATMAEAHRA